MQPSSFIFHPEHLETPSDIPFSLYWETAKISTWTFDKIIVEAVRTDLIDTDQWLYSAGSFVPTRDVYQQRVYELADYIQMTLTDELNYQGKSKRKVEIDNTYPVTFIPDKLAVELMNLSAKPIPPLDPVRPGGRTMLLQVSIAEAIFWGEQHCRNNGHKISKTVSIAEAILWGEQLYGGIIPSCEMEVSIAEAILWGEQR